MRSLRRIKFLVMVNTKISTRLPEKISNHYDYPINKVFFCMSLKSLDYGMLKKKSISDDRFSHHCIQLLQSKYTVNIWTKGHEQTTWFNKRFILNSCCWQLLSVIQKTSLKVEMIPFLIFVPLLTCHGTWMSFKQS